MNVHSYQWSAVSERMAACIATTYYAQAVLYATNLNTDPVEIKIRDHVRATLPVATPYYWSAETSELARRMAPSMPDWTLTDQAFPTKCGFMFWEDPLIVIDGCHCGEDHETLVEAASWRPITLTHGFIPAFEIIFYIRPPHRDRWINPIPQSMAMSSFAVYAIWWPTGHTVKSMENSPFSDFSARVSGATAGAVAQMEKFFAASLTFMGQHIVTQTTQRVDRGTRRRLMLEPTAPQNLVRVVELRKTGYVSSGAGIGDVDWKNRWIVQAHWRRQWHPSLKIHQPKLIHEYIKGPDDKPLKVPKDVVYVVRK